MRNFRSRRALPALLALALCLTLLPVPARAEEPEEERTESPAETVRPDGGHDETGLYAWDLLRPGQPALLTAGRAPDRVIPIRESASFYCGSGNGNSYTWWLDPGGYDIFTISPSGSRCVLTAKKPGRTQLWVQYSVSLYGPGQDRYGNWITVPYPDGYEQIGWLVEAVGEPCTVTFVPGGGSAPVTRAAYVEGTVSAPEGIARAGFVLDGWFTDAACTLRYDFSAPLAGDLTLYAGWLPARTVTFVSLGSRTEEQTADGRTVSWRVPAAPRGYAFEGWHTDAACTRPYDFTRPVAANLTLYAKWRLLDEITVTYDCMDGSEPVRVTYYAGETPDQPVPPAREGRVFQGWYTNAGCGADALYRFDGPLDGPLTLYAGWERDDPVRVLFDRQDGSAPEARWVSRGKPLEEPEAPEREGYLFDGWYTAPSCYAAWDFSDGVKSAMTLYAGWKRNEYTVEFVNSIPTGEFSSEDTLWRTVTVAHGDTVEEPASPPPGGLYLFAGWSENGRMYDFSLPVTGDLTLRTERMPFFLQDYGGELSANSRMTWSLDASTCAFALSGEGGTGSYICDPVYPGTFPDWYAHRLKIRTIEVGEGVDSIGENTFQWCCNAVSASLPESLERIGSGAFQSCFNLKEIGLPSSLKSIGSGAFQDCESLLRADIPEGVTELGARAFYGCTSLKSVSLPEGLESIGEYAFLGCERLEELALPDTLTAVGSHAFEGCARLRTIVIPESVETIGEGAFDFRSVQDGPVHIFYAGSREQWKAVNIHPNNRLDGAVLHYNCAGSGELETVFFNSRGGSPVEDQLRRPGELLEEPQAPERAGYTFTGWYRDDGGSLPWDFAGDGVNGGTTLYAGWAPVSHTVSFSGGDRRTVLHGERAEEPTAPVRAGARFNGWYTDADARTRYLFRSPVTEDLTLYPGWLEERRDPAAPGPDSPNGSWEVLERADRSVVLTGPETVVKAVRQVWAASYEGERLSFAAAGRLEAAEGAEAVKAVFSARPGKGWRLFLLDAAGRPLGTCVVLN